MPSELSDGIFFWGLCGYPVGLPDKGGDFGSIFFSFRCFHTAGYVDRFRSGDADGFADVFRGQPAGKHPRFARIFRQQRPVEAVSRAAVFRRMVGIEQKCLSVGKTVSGVLDV